MPPSDLGFPGDEPPPVAVRVTTLIGEGAYEGLSAMIVNRNVSSTEELEGFIFEGALPPIPDPIDPNSPGYAE